MKASSLELTQLSKQIWQVLSEGEAKKNLELLTALSPISLVGKKEKLCKENYQIPEGVNVQDILGGNQVLGLLRVGYYIIYPRIIPSMPLL